MVAAMTSLGCGMKFGSFVAAAIIVVAPQIEMSVIVVHSVNCCAENNATTSLETETTVGGSSGIIKKDTSRYDIIMVRPSECVHLTATNYGNDSVVNYSEDAATTCTTTTHHGRRLVVVVVVKANHCDVVGNKEEAIESYY